MSALLLSRLKWPLAPFGSKLNPALRERKYFDVCSFGSRCFSSKTYVLNNSTQRAGSCCIPDDSQSGPLSFAKRHYGPNLDYNHVLKPRSQKGSIFNSLLSLKSPHSLAVGPISPRYWSSGRPFYFATSSSPSEDSHSNPNVSARFDVSDKNKSEFVENRDVKLAPSSFSQNRFKDTGTGRSSVSTVSPDNAGRNADSDISATRNATIGSNGKAADVSGKPADPSSTARKRSNEIAKSVTKKITMMTKTFFKALSRNAKQLLFHPISTTANYYDQIRKGIKHTAVWLKTGSALFIDNLKISYSLVQKKLRGHPLTLREHKLLVRTTYDIFKLVPFSFFIIIPFAEFLLPIVIRLYPGILPSTFFQKQYDTDYLARKLQAKQELAKFFQEMVHERTHRLLEKKLQDQSFREKAEKLQIFQEKLLAKDQTDVNPFLSLEETIELAKLFKAEFVLEKLSLESLQLMCRLLGLKPYNIHMHVVLQLRRHLLRIQREDREILWEGLHVLTHEELIEACKERAMRFYGISDDQMRQQMVSWLELSSRPDIPPLLLLWSRCITMTHSPIHIHTTEATSDSAVAPMLEDGIATTPRFSEPMSPSSFSDKPRSSADEAQHSPRGSRE